jgi:hypothetical protein
MRTHVLALCLVLTACSSTADTSNPDAYVPPVDASTMDTGVDLGPRDLGVDLGQPDTGVDLGPPCECTSGPCCDGCFFRPATYQCSDQVDGPATFATCALFNANVCGGAGWPRIEYQSVDRWCTGNNAECIGRSFGMVNTRSVVCDPDGMSPYAWHCVNDTTLLGAHCEPCP